MNKESELEAVWWRRKGQHEEGEKVRAKSEEKVRGKSEERRTRVSGGDPYWP